MSKQANLLKGKDVEVNSLIRQDIINSYQLNTFLGHFRMQLVELEMNQREVVADAVPQ